MVSGSLHRPRRFGKAELALRTPHRRIARMKMPVNHSAVFLSVAASAASRSSSVGCGIVKAAVKGVRREIAQVLFVEFAQGRDQGLALLHQGGRKGVRLVFVAARQAVEQRRQPKRHQPRTAERTAATPAPFPGGETKAAQKPFLPRQHGNEVKAASSPPPSDSAMVFGICPFL